MSVALRPAATVLLLRDGNDGLEIWLMERNRAAAFMGSAWVFPGGRVDPADAEVPASEAPDDGIARAFRVAAARELEEEANIRLGGEHYDLTRLRPWAHWITPELEPRRYDTWFFAAELPAGQDPRIDGNEATNGGWFRPADALERHVAGRLPLAPPTLRTLHELTDYPSVADALRASRRLPAICPCFRRVDGEGTVVVNATAEDLAAATAGGEDVWVLLPGDPDHPSDEQVDGATRFRFSLGRWWAR